MNQIGTDVRFVEGTTLWGDGLQALEALHSQGLEGVNIRTIDELSPTLDLGELETFSQAAADLGMYVEMGIGKVNPYMTAELPIVRTLGDGDYVLGLRRMIERSAALGWTTLWTACGGVKEYATPWNTDRSRRDAPWRDQLDATARLVRKLVPVLEDVGVVLGIETHEEITTFELVELISAVDSPAVGICLDPANVVVRGEDPVAAVSRVAPYVVSTQLRDISIHAIPDGVTRILRPCGDGQLDWGTIVSQITTHRPGVRMTIEGIGGAPGRMDVPYEQEMWRALHPDFSKHDRLALETLAALTAQDVAAGITPTLEQLDVVDPNHRRRHDGFVQRSAAHIRSHLTV